MDIKKTLRNGIFTSAAIAIVFGIFLGVPTLVGIFVVMLLEWVVGVSLTWSLLTLWVIGFLYIVQLTLILYTEGKDDGEEE